MNNFSEILLPGKLIYSNPRFVERPYPWLQHAPFAFFLVEVLKPEIFVELGTHSGNSYFAFCQMVDALKLNTRCYAVDTWEGDDHSGFYGKEVFDRVKDINAQHFQQFSYLLKMKFDDALSYFGDTSIDLLHIDGMHSYDAVKHDFDSWLPKMGPKGVVVFHDTNVREREFGVWKFFGELKSKYTAFEFLHGHGLGVVCVGEKVKTEFLQFIDQANQNANVQHLFATLGNRVLALQERDDITKERDKLKTEFAQSGKFLEKKQSEIDHLKGTLSEKNEELLALKKEISINQDHQSSLQEASLKDKDMINQLQLQLSSAKEEVFAKQGQISILEVKFKLQTEQFGKKQERIAALENRLYSLQDELIEKSKSLAVQNERLHSKGELLLLRERRIVELKEQIKIQDVNIRQIQQSLSWKFTKPFRLVGGLLSGLRNSLYLSLSIVKPIITLNVRGIRRGLRHIKYSRILKRSGKFDIDWYLKSYPDVPDSGIDPVFHYVRYGAQEGRNPSAEFNTLYYLQRYEDVAISDINPLIHYVLYGEKEGRTSLSSFDNTTKNYEQPIVNAEDENILANIDTIENGKPLKEMTFPGKAIMPQVVVGDLYSHGQYPANIDSPRRKNLLFIAHYLGHKQFGSERSFLDILSVVDCKLFRVIVVLPEYVQSYIDDVKRYSDKIFVFPYKWKKYESLPDENVLKAFVDVIVSEKIDLVFVNTITLCEPFLAAKRTKTPSICNVRELINQDPYLEDTLKYHPTHAIEETIQLSDFIIANSETTRTVFSKPGADFVVNNSVDHTRFDIPNVSENEKIYVGLMGSNIEKKGVYDFLELAKHAEKQLPNVIFRLIGPKNKHTENIAKIIAEKGIKNLEIIGYINDPLKAVGLINICVNFSLFAESFGRSVLEAMAARRPVIVYNWGALPELVDHEKSGFIIPYRHPLGALEYLKRLAERPTLIAQMGERARSIAVERYSVEIMRNSLSKVFASVFEGKGRTIISSRHTTEAKDLSGKEEKRVSGELVSVIVPNYNYERYIGERIHSIINQSYKNIELIFLDDASTDKSLKLAQQLLDSTNIRYKIITNSKNQGTYKQWLKGIAEAEGDYVWIAEADDSARPDFLETLVQGMKDEAIVMAYCQSMKIDEQGEVIVSNNLIHTDDLDTVRWKNNYVVSGQREVIDYLFYRNTIPNVSACLFRKKHFNGAEHLISHYHFCGDWLLYAFLLKKGRICYISDTLNMFRRHSHGVTRKQEKSLNYMNEVLGVQKFIIENYPITSSDIKKRMVFFDKDNKFDGMSKNSKHPKALDFYREMQESVEGRRRFLFITTNNGSHNGGSEQLWILTATALAERNNDVFVLIKKWDPQPYFFNKFDKTGITLLFKEEFELQNMAKINPDLVVVSLGDQDEGTEYFNICNEENIPYVIINQLVKEPMYWPIKQHKTEQVKSGYLNAKQVFFTSRNNHKVMEKRLSCEINNAATFFQPFFFNKEKSLVYPDFKNGINIAIPARLLTIHKGQDLAIEVLSDNKWRKRNIKLNLYGSGPDEMRLKEMVAKYSLDNIKFFKPKWTLPNPDLHDIWRVNHAILLPSYMEGMPIVLLNAIAHARVPIVTNVGGHCEIIRDNITGFIASEPTVKDIDDALERAYMQKDNWEQIGMKAKNDLLATLPDDPIDNFINKLFKLV